MLMLQPIKREEIRKQVLGHMKLEVCIVHDVINIQGQDKNSQKPGHLSSKAVVITAEIFRYVISGVVIKGPLVISMKISPQRVEKYFIFFNFVRRYLNHAQIIV